MKNVKMYNEGMKKNHYTKRGTWNAKPTFGRQARNTDHKKQFQHEGFPKNSAFC
jgi:hypothetical protein